jgi:protein-S-isoprenylcysteine O-methyltransferase Ste14
MIELVAFAAASIPILIVSRPALRHPNSHGFYRTFAWEAVLALVVVQARYWFVEPLAWHQIIAWILLTLSIPLVVGGAALLRRIGRPDARRQDAGLIAVEKTTQLVTVGLYRFIRHPFYSSLLFLAWGAFFKRPSWLALALAAVATSFLVVTGKVEERENSAYFGRQYRAYMKKTKMFVPFIF